jgi:hypothetical protein
VVLVDSLHQVSAGDEPSWADAGGLQSVGARLKEMAISMDIPVIATMDRPPTEADQIMSGISDLLLEVTVDEDIVRAGGVGGDPGSFTKKEVAFREVLEKIRESNPLEFSHSEYAVLAPQKHRSGALSPVVFIFNKAWHSFEELDM